MLSVCHVLSLISKTKYREQHGKWMCYQQNKQGYQFCFDYHACTVYNTKKTKSKQNNEVIQITANHHNNVKQSSI